jgi:predicted transcriptional regulator
MVKSGSMPVETVKQRAIEALQGLPDDATFEDAIERLCFLAKIDEGLEELDAGKGVPHAEVKRRLGF